MEKAEAIERLEYLKAKAQRVLEQKISEWIAVDIRDTVEAYDMAIEALQTEPSNSEKPNNCEDFFREPTAEERKAVADYIDSISVPTGVNVFDLMDEPQTTSTPYKVDTSSVCKTEPSNSEKPNNSTISKMEQVEDEPQTYITEDGKRGRVMPYEDDYKMWLEKMLIEMNPDWVCDGMYDMGFTHEWCEKYCGEDSEYVTPKCLHMYYHHIAQADRKTEPSNSEKPNNSTISKMEQVDEPQTDEEYINSLPWTEVGNGEQTDCAWR